MTVVRTMALGLSLVAVLSGLADAGSMRSRGGWWWRQAVTAPTYYGGRQLIEITARPVVVEHPAAAPAPLAGVPGAAATPPVAVVPVYTNSHGYIVPPTPSPVPSYDYDALVNFGDGPYASAATLTTGGAEPWYTSPVVAKVFGGTPTPEERVAFTASVLEKVEHTYALSGIPISLTGNPSDSAAHSLSVVSGTSYGPQPDAIGIANIGGDGFSFIDKLGAARTVDELEWALAHNVAHELMHTFGVEHHDATGQYLDGAVSSWSQLVNPDATFGPDAVADLLVQDFTDRLGPIDYGSAQLVAHGTGCNCPAHGLLLAAPSPVPEPTTVAVWSLALAGWVAVRQVRRRTA